MRSKDSDRPQTGRTSESYNCSICKDIGYVSRGAMLGDPDFGKVYPCVCKSDEIAARRLNRLQRLSNLSGLHERTFAQFNPQPGHLSPEQSHSLRNAFETCKYFAQDPDGWLLLTGTYGCGKTHLAAAIANELLNAGRTVIFQTVPDLLDHLRSTFGPNSEISFDQFFEQLQSAPILILDDFGAHSSSQWANEKLFQLLNHRYNTELPTVITTNLRLDALEPRLRSRISDAALVTKVLITAPDFRSPGSPVQQELSTLSLYSDKQFGNFNVNRGDLSGTELLGLRKIADACHKFAEQPQGWLVLTSVHHWCGKTHLAAAIANFHNQRHIGAAMFIVVPDLLDHLRATFDPNATTSYDVRFDQIKNAQLLILDDLGTESATPWAREKLFQLLNYRYTAALPTVITTFSLKDIEPRLLNRISDTTRCKVYEILAPRYRYSQQDDSGRQYHQG